MKNKKSIESAVTTQNQTIATDSESVAGAGSEHRDKVIAAVNDYLKGKRQPRRRRRPVSPRSPAGGDRRDRRVLSEGRQADVREAGPRKHEAPTPHRVEQDSYISTCKLPVGVNP